MRKVFWLAFLIICSSCTSEKGVLLNVSIDKKGIDCNGNESVIFEVKVYNEGSVEKPTYCNQEGTIDLKDYKIFVPLKEGENMVSLGIGLQCGDKHFSIPLDTIICPYSGGITECEVTIPSSCLKKCFGGRGEAQGCEYNKYINCKLNTDNCS